MSVRMGSRGARLGLALFFAGMPAFAAGTFDDPYDLPEAPRPPTLPELTHGDVEATLESTIGLLYPKADTPGWTKPSGAFVQRANVEVPLGARRWFTGATYEAVYGVDPPFGGTPKTVGGNLEVYGRTVWATRTGLAFGGGLGLMLPASSFDVDSPAARIATSAAAVRPWDFQFFEKDAVTARPFVDVRVLDGPFVIQFREGIDWSFLSGKATRSELSAVTALYVGYRLGSVIDAGLEAFELYFIEGQATDASRAFFGVSPSVRLMTRVVQPCFSVVSSLADPLYPASERSIALRLAITVLWDSTTRTLEQDPRSGAHDAHGRVPKGASP